MFDPISARGGLFRRGTKKIPAIRIHRHYRSGSHALIGLVSYDRARAFADQIHDACDAYEAQQRAKRGHHD